MAQIQQVVNSIQDEFRFNDKGQAFVSIRGAARLAAVDPTGMRKSFVSAGDENPRPLAEFLLEQGFDMETIILFPQTGIPDTALSLILEYFAYECRPQYRTPEAKACFRAFCAIGIRSWLQEALGYEEETVQQTTIPYYYQRLRLFQERTGRIPEGYFCIFEETLPLVGQLERHGYNIPDDAVIDSSIGKLFCGYMRSEYNLEPNDYCLKYPHHFPGQSRPVPANLYPIDWLIVFRKWLSSRYYNLHLPKYFRGRKDVKAIEAVNRFLGLLPGSRAS